jgi:hypothetical protein
MDWGIFWTILGSALGIIGFVYTFLRNVKEDIKSMIDLHDNKFEVLDNRIFQLAMGKSLKDIMKEEKEELK